MRITKKMLEKSNESKRVIIFALLAIGFVLSMTVSVYIVEMNKTLRNMNDKIDTIIANTQKIQNILTIGEE